MGDKKGQGKGSMRHKDDLYTSTLAQQKKKETISHHFLVHVADPPVECSYNINMSSKYQTYKVSTRIAWLDQKSFWSRQGFNTIRSPSLRDNSILPPDSRTSTKRQLPTVLYPGFFVR